MREYEHQGVDGVLIVMLTYGPGQRVARALGQTRLPLCLANVQPEPQVTAAWDMADMTYNQGVHGAQDTANAMVRAGVRVRRRHRGLAAPRVPRPDRPLGARGRRGDARGAAEGRAGRLRDERHGRHPLRRGRAAARARPATSRVIAPGELYRATVAVSAGEVAEVIAFEDERFEIDPRLSDAEREDHARMQVALERLMEERGCEAFSTHFDAIGEDGRFARLPFAAASSLMAKGYGFARRGRHADRRARPRRARPDRRRALHRDVRDGLPVGLGADEPHGRGQLADRPRRSPGAADQAADRDRRARRPADVPVRVPARAGDAGDARRARRRVVPARRLRGREPRRPGPAGPGDALGSLPAATSACAPASTPGCGSAARTTR